MNRASDDRRVVAVDRLIPGDVVEVTTTQRLTVAEIKPRRHATLEVVFVEDLDSVLYSAEECVWRVERAAR